jgi:DNA-binding MarR family transcriptional regulator
MSVYSQSPMSETPRGTAIQLVRLSKALHRRMSEEALGMPWRQLVMLGILREREPALQQQVCEALMMDPNNCVILLNELEEAGHIVRKRDPADRRRHVVELTGQGRKALERAERAQSKLEDQVFGDLSAEERATLHELVTRALDAPVPA